MSTVDTIDGTKKVVLTQQQIDAIKRLGNDIATLSEYRKLRDQEKVVFQFDPTKYEIQEKDFEGDGRVTKSIVFEVYDVNNDIVQKWSVSSKAVLEKLQGLFNQGFFSLAIKRIGTGLKTAYDIVPASQEE